MTYHYHFEKGDPSKNPLLLLHGTGADEFDLIPLAKQIAPGAPLLSIRGNVVEHGQNRYFHRHPDGTFDQQDLLMRTQTLADFIAETAPKHEIALGDLMMLGFSNGANIGSSLMFLRPEILRGAMLLRGMIPFIPDHDLQLDGKKILLLSGADDPIIPDANAAKLAEIYEKSGADILYRTMPAGHGLTSADVLQAHDWYKPFSER